VSTTAVNDEILRIHREEKVNLIATTLDLPGSRIENIFDIIREFKERRKVSMIIVCEDTL
jgi:hypothetical protein